MLTLQQILESDSVSSLVAKVNLNFQQIAVSGGGPQGLPGEQGIPGLPGRQGEIGHTGPIGPTGSVVGIIPFASQVGGSTGPTGAAGPWNTYSYEYLNNIVGIGPSQVGHIWIDHYNDGFWRYNDVIDDVTSYTDSPYSNLFPSGTMPPGGTGYFSAEGWYFYPLKKPAETNPGDVWINDITTYQCGITGLPPGAYATGPFSDPSPLTVKNARLLSKYGTVWISSGNSVDDNGIVDENNLITPSIYDWGNPLAANPAVLSQPSRVNSGVDRLYFKQSIDTLPYLSNVTARSFTDESEGVSDPAAPSGLFPKRGGSPTLGPLYWVKPLYSPSLDTFSPIQFYTERRNDEINYPPNTIYGSLGLFSYSALGEGKTVGALDYRKSLWVYSTRTSKSPEENTTSPYTLSSTDTFNIGEILFDVRKLTASNQFVCSLPQDTYLSSDWVRSQGGAGPRYNESFNTFGRYTVTQGYISAINGKSLTSSEIDVFNYGTGVAGNNTNSVTRSSWFGSAAMHTPSNWDEFDSQSSSSNPLFIDKSYRFAGMRERAKKTSDTSDTFFLNELIFYTSQFSLPGNNVNADATLVSLQDNAHNSLPGFYLSPFRNFGIGTFTRDDSGVFEPVARLHAHAFIRSNDVDGGDINPSISDRELAPTYVSKYTPTPWSAYPEKLYKGGAITIEETSSTYLDFYLGRVSPDTNERANSLTSAGDPNNRPGSIVLDTAIRRETWNDGIDQASIMRLGVSPVGNLINTNVDYTIGQDAETIRYDFQISLVPLNPMTQNSSSDLRSSVGVGIQNLYPRARFHLYGKNLQNEGLLGNEPFNPGQAAAAGTTATDGYYPSANHSTGQVIIDKIESSYTYNVGYKEYPYEAYGIVGLTGATGPNPATGTSGSPNAANFPNWDSASPTRNVIPWQPQTRNFAAWSLTGSHLRQGEVYMHGEQYRNLFDATSYIGFNLFRDLLSVGDNLTETRWMTGTDGENGGSAIVTTTGGDMAFVNIKSGRDGGLYYRPWEQRGLSTRDVLNNISLVLTRKGDMGLGAEPGIDYNAYSSLERNSNGWVNYVPVSGDQTTAAPAARGVMGAGTATNKPYGLVNYTSLNPFLYEFMDFSAAAKVNSNATEFEYVRFELGAEKFYGKNSRSSLAAGYGYPPNNLFFISGPETLNYVHVNATYPDEINYIEISTDEEGRIYKIQFGNNIDPITNPVPYIIAITLPHPTEFNFNSGTGWAQSGFTAPAGSCAGILKSNVDDWVYDFVNDDSIILDNTNFEKEDIGLANIRLNNFIAGEGMSPATGEKSQSQILQEVKEARQKSPKLILSFLEADNTTIPGSIATNTSETIGTNRPVSGTAAYRKVNTVIASAQNESSLREYWIPKSDNTGGTFMVWTDHYGQREYESGFDNQTISTSRFYLEEVVALEFVPSYTGITSGSQYITNTTTNTRGRSTADYPMHVKYYNSLMGTTKYGVTGTTQNAFLPSQYGRKIKPLGQPAVDEYVVNSSSELLIATSNTGLALLRNVDKFYNIVQNGSTNWDNGWNSQGGAINNETSQFRFKRINSDFALIDFNMTIQVKNPSVQSGLVLPTTPAGSLIDAGSPRWTQYIRLTYLPSKDTGSNDRDYFMKQFGNSLSFMNWSSFNQWYPGTAVTSDGGDIESGDALSKTGGPNYTMDHSYDTDHIQNIGWNGNFYDATMSSSTDGTLGILGPIFGAADAPTIYPQTNISPFYGNTFMTGNISKMLIWMDPAEDPENKSFKFGSYMGKAYSILGNDYLSRVRNCTWRVVPRIGTNFGDGLGGEPIVNPGVGGIITGRAPAPEELAIVDVKNNSFTLEIMFDKPILHIDTPFAKTNFTPDVDGEPCYPYQYLTVSGQSIVRYSDLTNTRIGVE